MTSKMKMFLHMISNESKEPREAIVERFLFEVIKGH